MSAAETTVSSCEPIELELAGSKDLRRILCVQRSRYGNISVYVRPQLPKTKRLDCGRWFRASVSVSLCAQDAAEQVAIRYYKSGPALWVGHNVWFDLLSAEAEELASRFGFRVTREET